VDDDGSAHPTDADRPAHGGRDRLARSAELLRARRFGDLDPDALAEYLTDMAKRDRREVYRRLVGLLVMLLRLEFTVTHSSVVWRRTIREQRRELRMMLESDTLRIHAADVLADAYADARKAAAAKTDLPVETFPTSCLWGIEEALADSDAR
jgi:hypothetical protein